MPIAGERSLDSDLSLRSGRGGADAGPSQLAPKLGSSLRP